MRAVHMPQTAADLLPTSPARARLAFDELLANQLALRMVRRATEATPGRSYKGNGTITDRLKGSLPFAMTGAQGRAIQEISRDQALPKRMLRMLQGDVGSGKTLVALWAMLTTLEADAQAALLAPTEVLARQHYESIRALLEPLNITVGLLLGQGRGTVADNSKGGKDPKISRKATLEALAQQRLASRA